MTGTSMDQLLADNQDAILVGSKARMRGDESLGRVADQREISESDLTSQVVGFWLQAIRTDLELGSTAAMEQNMGWLVALRDGHRLPFEDETVARMFADISDEIESRLETEDMRAQYRDYREKVERLITAAFPGQGGAA